MSASMPSQPASGRRQEPDEKSNAEKSNNAAIRLFARENHVLIPSMLTPQWLAIQ